MSRYWVIAPFEAKAPDTFEKVWKFDIRNDVISIGWNSVGDVSKMSREQLSSAVAAAYPDQPVATKSLYGNMLWSFYHDITAGDIVVARRGRKILAAVGTVTQPAVFAPGRNPAIDHPHFLPVRWQQEPRDKVFPSLVFPMQTLTEIDLDHYHGLLEGSGGELPNSQPSEIIDQTAFVLEKYLEDFIVSNFDAIFKGKLRIHEDGDGADGQQYPTDIGPIDILAIEPDSGSYVVIELKRGQTSDHVVGQILRYMGWVKKNLCKNNQIVRGLVICRDPDPKLSYAIEMTPNINIQYYSVSFKLRESA